jgi:hypothetical protein
MTHRWWFNGQELEVWTCAAEGWFSLTAVTGHTDDIREKLKSNSVVNRYAVHQSGMFFDNGG